MIGSSVFIYTDYTSKKSLFKDTVKTLIQNKKLNLKVEIDNFINFLQTEHKYNRKNAENMLAANSNNILFIFTRYHMREKYIISIIKLKNRSNTVSAALFKNGIDILNPSFSLDNCTMIKENKHQTKYNGMFYNCDTKPDKIFAYVAAQSDKFGKLIIVSYIKRSDIQKSLKNIALKNIDNFLSNNNKNSYIFILKLLNINGGKKFAKVITIKSRPNLTNRYISDEKTDIKGNYWRKEYLKGLREKGEVYLTYWHSSLASKWPQKKLTFIKLYKPMNWIIGTGFYPDDYIKSENLAADKTFAIFYPLLAVFILGVIVFIIISILWIKLSRNIKDDMQLINKSIADVGTSDIVIDRNMVHYIRFDTIANSINALSSAIKHGKWLLQKSENDFLMSLATLIEVRDPYTRYHSENVAYYAKEMARIIGLDKTSCNSLYKAGLLHDIGKIGIPDIILLKPGKLTSNEYDIIKQHSLFSYFAVKDIERFESMALPIKQHHERCDGSGYPDGLTRDKITIGGRILAIADVFDAITQARVYRTYGFSIKKSIKILQESYLDNDILDQVIPYLDDMFRNSAKTKTFIPEIISKERESIFYKDYLTGLLGRTKFIEKIKQLIDKKNQFFLFNVDVKHLSNINYTHSQDTGDHLLECIADILKNSTEVHYPARTGGDSFQFIYKMKEPEAFCRLLRNRLQKCDNKIKAEYYISYIKSSKGKNERNLMHAADVEIKRVQNRCSVPDAKE